MLISFPRVSVHEDRLATALSEFGVRYIRQFEFRCRDRFIRAADFYLLDSGMILEIDPPALPGIGAIDRVARDLVYVEHGYPTIRLDNRMLNGDMVRHWALRIAQLDARWSSRWTPYRRQQIMARRASNVLPMERQLGLELWDADSDDREDSAA